jgi:hypothetical protein
MEKLKKTYEDLSEIGHCLVLEEKELSFDEFKKHVEQVKNS